jgi:hypothetical protein
MKDDPKYIHRVVFTTKTLDAMESRFVKEMQDLFSKGKWFLIDHKGKEFLIDANDVKPSDIISK